MACSDSSVQAGSCQHMDAAEMDQCESGKDPPGFIQHALTVLVFLSRVVLVPPLPASSRSPRFFP